MNTQSRLNTVTNSASKKGAALSKSIEDTRFSGLSLGSIEHYVDELKDTAGEAFDTSVSFIKRNPVYALLGVAAVGLLVGTIVKKGMKKI